MNDRIDLRDFWKAYLAVFLSFVTSRILLQTDIVMVAPLGEAATAAFGVPGRLMIIDAIVAYALGPVISVAVSRATDKQDKYSLITSALGFTFAISMVLTLIGLVVYPHAVTILIKDVQVLGLAKDAVFWMTLSIPVRMLTFVASMCLFACNEGKRVSYIYAFTISANAFLNWLFIYKLQFGLTGVYLSIFCVSAIQLIWLLWLTRKLVGRFPIARFTLQWLRSLMEKIGAEWVRLISWQGEGFAVLTLLASRPEWLPALSAYGVIAEASFLLLMPVVALMRTAALQIAKVNPEKSLARARSLIKPLIFYAIPVSITVGLLLITLSNVIGTQVYRLEGERLAWWMAFAFMFGLGLPTYTYSYLQRACFQACDQFAHLTKVEMAVIWLIYIPMVWWALVKFSPMFFFALFVGKEALIALWLQFRYRDSLYKNVAQQGAPEVI